MRRAACLSLVVCVACGDNGTASLDAAVEDSAVDAITDECRPATTTICWEGNFQNDALCAVFSTAEPMPTFGRVNVASWTMGGAPTAVVEVEGVGDLTLGWYGAQTNNWLEWFPGRSTPTSNGVITAQGNDGSFSTKVMAPSDIVVTGISSNGDLVGAVYRDIDLAATASATLDGTRQQAFRIANVSLPPGVTGVVHQLFTAGNTVVPLGDSSAVRYGLPVSQELAGDRYAIEFDHGEGRYAFTTTTFGDLELNPAPLTNVAGLTMTATVDPMTFVQTIDTSWDLDPAAVGYLVSVSVPICCALGAVRSSLTYYSAAALGGAACRGVVQTTYKNTGGPKGRVYGSVRAVTSSRPDMFPLGWPTQDTLTGVTKGVQWWAPEPPIAR